MRHVFSVFKLYLEKIIRYKNIQDTKYEINKVERQTQRIVNSRENNNFVYNQRIIYYIKSHLNYISIVQIKDIGY